MKDFNYLGDGEIYLDGACQSLRPRPVIDAISKYYTEHNSCGERVKYKWGRVTDEKVEETRGKVLKFLKLSARKYTTSFTLNTTYGINLILSQIKARGFKKVGTSDIEHNSPCRATVAFTKAIVVVNCASNFDGRKLSNIKDLTKAVHKAGGIIIIDAAQAMSHSADVIRGVEVDAICFSAHKMYAPSLGVIVWRDDLTKHLDELFLGGGMVDDVEKNSYKLSAENKEHRYTRFESGLQAWGEIVGLGAAIDWINKLSKKTWKELERNTEELYDFLAASPKVHLVNHEPNPTMSFYVDGVDSHLLGEALSRENIMARTGYFCAHYYLDHVLHLPPLVRFSLGFQTTTEDIKKIKKVLEKVLH